MQGDLVPVQKDVMSSAGKTFQRTYWVSAAEAKQLVAEGKAKPVGAGGAQAVGKKWDELTDDEKQLKWNNAALKASATKAFGKIDQAIASGDMKTAQGLVEQKLAAMRDGMGEELFNHMHDWVGQFPDAQLAQAALGQLANHPIGAALAQVYGKKWQDAAGIMIQYGDRASKIPGSVKMFGLGPAASLQPPVEKPAASVAMSEAEAKQGIEHVVQTQFGGDAAKAVAALHGPDGDQAAKFFEKALGPGWKQKVEDHINEKFGKKAVANMAAAGDKLKAAQDNADAAKAKLDAAAAKNAPTEKQGPSTTTSAPGAVAPPPTGAPVNLPPPVMPSGTVAPFEQVNEPSPSTFTPTGEAAGGTQGGKWYKDENGQRWFGKDYKGDTERLATEHIANGIYQALGINAPETKIVNINGTPTIMSKAIDGQPAGSASALDGKSDATKGFVADAFLGNWDVVGQGYDNMLVGKDGSVARIDNGGSLFYRAQGGKKDFGANVTELDSMRDPKINPTAAKVFGKLSDDEIKAQASEFVKNYDSKRNEIHAMIDASPMSAAGKEKVKAALDARAENIKQKWASSAPTSSEPTEAPAPPKSSPVAETKPTESEEAHEPTAEPSQSQKLGEAFKQVSPIGANNVDEEAFNQHLANMPPKVAAAMEKAFGKDWHEKVKEHLKSEPETPSSIPGEPSAEHGSKENDASSAADDAKPASGDKAPTTEEIAAKSEWPHSTIKTIETALQMGDDPHDALAQEHGYDKDQSKAAINDYHSALHELGGKPPEPAEEQEPTASPKKLSTDQLEKVADAMDVGYNGAKEIHDALQSGKDPIETIKNGFLASDEKASEILDKYHAAVNGLDSSGEAKPSTVSHEDVAAKTGMMPYTAKAIHDAIYKDGVDPVKALQEKHGFDEDIAKSLVKKYADGEAAVATGGDEKSTATSKPNNAATGSSHDDSNALGAIGAATGLSMKQLASVKESLQNGKPMAVALSKAGVTVKPSIVSNVEKAFKEHHPVGQAAKQSNTHLADAFQMAKHVDSGDDKALNDHLYLKYGQDPDSATPQAQAFKEAYKSATATGASKTPPQVTHAATAPTAGKSDKWKSAAAKASATKAAKKSAQQNFAKAEQDLLEHKNSIGKLAGIAEDVVHAGGIKAAKDWHASAKGDANFDKAMTKAHGADWHQKIGQHIDKIEKMQQAKAEMDKLGGQKKSTGSPKQASAAKEKFIAEAQQAKAEANDEFKKAQDFQSKVDMDGVPPHVHAQVAKIAKEQGFAAAMAHLGVPQKAIDKMTDALKSWQSSSNSVSALLMRGAAIKIMAGGDPEKEKELLGKFEKSIDDHMHSTGGSAATAQSQKEMLRKGMNDPVIAKTLQAAAVVAQSQYEGKKTITLYRGVHGKQAEQLLQNLKEGKPLVLGVHSMSCWSEKPGVAASGPFGGGHGGKSIVLKVEVPVSSIVHSTRVPGQALNNGLHSSEKEVIIATHNKIAVQVHK